MPKVSIVVKKYGTQLLFTRCMVVFLPRNMTSLPKPRELVDRSISLSETSPTRAERRSGEDAKARSDPIRSSYTDKLIRWPLPLRPPSELPA